MRFPKINILVLVFGFFLLIEGGIRISGITDFPLYDVNNQIGYIPKPSQSGAFLHTNTWKFNSLSMGASEFKPSAAVDTLLIGDSLVLGGNPYQHEDKLAYQLELKNKQPVWPISAGSWSLRNELMYFELHQDVLEKIDQFIFLLNSGDFDQASSWSCEINHPTKYPVFRTIYVLNKYFYSWEDCDRISSELQVEPGNWKKELQNFLAKENVKNKPVLFYLYPNKKEAAEKKDKDILLEDYGHQILAISNGSTSVYTVRKDPRWNEEFYRDDIHPNVKGIQILASIINRPSQDAVLSR
jgi:hypothetical protein